MASTRPGRAKNTEPRTQSATVIHLSERRPSRKPDAGSDAADVAPRSTTERGVNDRAEHNMRVARSRSAPPTHRSTLVLIALLTLAGSIGVWLMLFV